MRYTLRQLEIFLSVAKYKNTTQAAEAMHLSQSAVSSALNQLEQNYDTQLFDRIGKRLELNAFGSSLRENAASLITQAEAFNQQLLGHSNSGDLTIGASYTIANYHAVTHLSSYLEEFPNASIDFRAGNSPDIVAMVLNHEVDLGMIESETSHKSLQVIPWIEDELVVFCSSQHPLAGKTRITSGDLTKAKWILREPDSGARQSFDRAFGSLISDVNIYMEFRHNEAIKRAVESGLGIGCLSMTALKTNFKDGSLVPLNIPKQHRMKRRFYIILPKRSYRNRAIEGWLEHCRVNY
jgi:DNA-binding transcriptional LysR family regulator